MKAIIKYPGSKWRLSNWIISHFPEHHSYLEPFFGSGAVFFNKQPSDIETINDLDDDVVNLFDCIRRDPERLAREIYLTPYARVIYDQAFTTVPDDPFERAMNFYIRLNMGRGYRTNGGKVGWKNDINGRERAYDVKLWNILPDRIMKAAKRLKDAQIEHMDAIELIRRFNRSDVLIYCDPPYMLRTRRGKQYKHELDDAGHEELLDTLLKHKGPVILSGYDNEMYTKKLRGWNREEKTSYNQAANKKEEILWMNFDPEPYQPDQAAAQRPEWQERILHTFLGGHV